MEQKRFLVTGGAGFIGSALARRIIADGLGDLCVVDKFTYAGRLSNIDAIARHPRFRLETVDICDSENIRRIFADFRPTVVLHLAAESHVDRSIDAPGDFIQTNVFGTFVLLQAAEQYWRTLSGGERDAFRFQQVSTDEVFGSLPAEGYFTETTAYAPNSPYSASKASADHFTRAWRETFGLPTMITNCSNNYGPHQFPEKLIPLTIINALEGKRLPIYGAGANIRDWLFVEDHVDALLSIAENGAPGRTYNIGGNNEISNLELVRKLCRTIDELRPNGAPRERLIEFVADRPGHDARYAIDSSRVSNELGWTPKMTLETGLRATVDWYLTNEAWWRPIRETAYRGERLGQQKPAPASSGASEQTT